MQLWSWACFCRRIIGSTQPTLITPFLPTNKLDVVAQRVTFLPPLAVTSRLFCVCLPQQAVLPASMQCLTHQQVSQRAARPFGSSKQCCLHLPNGPSRRSSVQQQQRARAAPNQPQTTQQKTYADMTIDDLDTSYCDDFVCTSSPAVEQTVRSLVSGPLDCSTAVLDGVSLSVSAAADPGTACCQHDYCRTRIILKLVSSTAS